MDHQPRPFFAKFESARGEDWTGQKLDLTTWEDQISFLELILTAINSVSFFIVAVLVVIIGVGMVNTMLMSIRERTGEIGTIRAMGMRRNSVLALFLVEAIILAFAASLAGGTLGAGIALGLDAAQIHIPVPAVQAILLSDTLHMAVDPVDLIIAVIAITIFTGLAALWPALRAARMQPVDAIRHSE
jgi:putative ABC transport system permease protein